MKSSNKFSVHPLTILVLLIGMLTGYFKYLSYIFGIVLFHELGHIFMLKIFRRKINSVEILPFGGLTKVDSKISENIFEDLLIAIGGILFQTILGLTLIFLRERDLITYNTFHFINTYNIFIILFNMVPICPLDGYKILKLFSELVLPFKKAYKLANVFAFISIGVFTFLKFEVVKNNLFVCAFLIFMCIEEIKNEPYIMNRFYVERMNYDFDYPKKRIKKVEDMYKNRVNFIGNIHEKEAIKQYFTDKSS